MNTKEKKQLKRNICIIKYSFIGMIIMSVLSFVGIIGVRAELKNDIKNLNVVVEENKTEVSGLKKVIDNLGAELKQYFAIVINQNIEQQVSIERVEKQINWMGR